MAGQNEVDAGIEEEKGRRMNKKLLFGIMVIVMAVVAGWLLLGYPAEVVEYGGSEDIARYQVEAISAWQDGKEQVIAPEDPKYVAMERILIPALHKLNLQARCVFSEADIQEIKQNDRVIELILKEPANITISQWIEPEERYHIPIDERGYRILENVKTALFILEDNQDRGLEAHILVGHEAEGRTGYTCWAIQPEGGTELDKTWIEQIEKTLTSGSEDFCGWSTYGNCSSDSDCITGGCSGQVCQSKYEETVITTCEWRDCFDAGKYGLGCRCIDGKCQWSETEPAK